MGFSGNFLVLASLLVSGLASSSADIVIMTNGMNFRVQDQVTARSPLSQVQQNSTYTDRQLSGSALALRVNIF